MACIVCSSELTNTVYKSPRIEVVRCKKCYLVFQATNSQELGNKLENYYLNRIVPYKPQNDFRSRRDKNIMNNVNQLSKAKDLFVDVGSGWGDFMCLAKSTFTTTVGIEPNKSQAEWSREKLGDENCMIKNSMYEESSFLDHSVDVITFIQVMEHVENPIDILLLVKKHLKKEGICIVDVPSFNNPRILLYRLLRKKSLVEGDFIVPHTFYYTYSSFKKIAELSGFEIVKYEIGQYSIKLGLKFPFNIIDWITKLLRVGSLTFYLKKAA